MKMQFKQIMLALVATLAAGQAAANVTAAEVLAAPLTSKTWISGASAPTYVVYAGWALGCDANTQRVFTASSVSGTVKPGASAMGNYMAYACKRGGVVSVLYHTIDGGSFNAYAPHLTGTAPDGTAMPTAMKRVQNLGTTACSSSASFVFPSTPAQTVPVSGTCSLSGAVQTDGGPAKPAGGFSDVEGALWGIDVSAAGTEGEAYVNQVFGLAVSTNLYRQLQVAQGIYTGATNAIAVANANAADPNYDPVNAPNISSSQYVSIAQFNGGYQTDWQPILGTAGVGKNVYLARRVATSGTQASSNAFFLENPCASGAPQGQLNPATSADSTGTFIVTQDASTGGVKTKLTNANTAGNFAIGVVSLENTWRGTSDGYRFVKVDGVHPEAGDDPVNGGMARNSSVNANYNFVMEMKSFVANTADSFGATIIPTIAAALGNPALCSDVPRGLFLNPAGGSSCAVGAQVGKGTKFGNNCSPVQLFY